MLVKLVLQILATISRDHFCKITMNLLYLNFWIEILPILINIYWYKKTEGSEKTIASLLPTATFHLFRLLCNCLPKCTNRSCLMVELYNNPFLLPAKQNKIHLVIVLFRSIFINGVVLTNLPSANGYHLAFSTLQLHWYSQVTQFSICNKGTTLYDDGKSQRSDSCFDHIWLHLCSTRKASGTGALSRA